MPNTLYAANRSTGVPEPPVPVAALTARLILADCVRLPDVPTTVTLAYPSVALLVADRPSRVEPVVLPGLNDALTPLGKPDTENVTLPLNPFTAVTVIAPPAGPLRSRAPRRRAAPPAPHCRKPGRTLLPTAFRSCACRRRAPRRSVRRPPMGAGRRVPAGSIRPGSSARPHTFRP